METVQASQVTPSRDRFKEFWLRGERLELGFLPEFGCHWSRLRASVKGKWTDLLVPVPDDETFLKRPTGYGSYLMAPWSNRIARAVFQFQGREHRLRSNFPDASAIHGDVRTRPWKVAVSTRERFEATLDSRELSDFNFPFALVFRHTMELMAGRLRVELEIENASGERAPAGFGFHPFFRRRLTPADRDVVVVVPASKVYPAEACIPTGKPVPVSGGNDLTGLKLLGAPGLDHCFTGITGPEYRIIHAGSGFEARIRVDPVFTHAVVYAPNDADGRPKEFFAVEPVTNANDGFNLLAKGWPETGVKVLEPGERWGGGMELTFGDV